MCPWLGTRSNGAIATNREETILCSQSITKNSSFSMKNIANRFVLPLLTVFSASSAFAADWWNMPDPDFVKQYGNLATGTQVQQSQFAWMLFARVNQPVPFQGQTFSQWELWPSDHDTFAPNMGLFTAQTKVRTRPHLQVSKLAVLLNSPHTLNALMNPFPSGGEEVTRNRLSYDYIIGKGLNTQAGIAKFLSASGAKVDFPIGTVEIKAFWVRGAIAGSYQVAGFSLTGIHVMMKIAPRPGNPFIDNSPSWFWTTFEFKQNKGLAAAQKLITYGDALPSAQVTTLLNQSGLGATPFVNYGSDGTQIQFSDVKTKNIVLGNTQIEWFLAHPANHDPTTWKSWSSSCHSCHAQASGQPSGQAVNFFSFTGPVGPLTGTNLPPSGDQSFDFVWALFNAQ